MFTAFSVERQRPFEQPSPDSLREPGEDLAIILFIVYLSDLEDGLLSDLGGQGLKGAVNQLLAQSVLFVM